MFATGMSGVPSLPQYAGMETFTGTQVHSSAFRTGEECKGKKAVVVGSNNSAHDICADLWENGARRDDGAALDARTWLEATR